MRLPWLIAVMLLFSGQVMAAEGPAPTAPRKPGSVPARFFPRSVSTQPLAMTGLRFHPRTVTTTGLVMTGMRFHAKTIRTNTLQMTGQRSPPRPKTLPVSPILR